MKLRTTKQAWRELHDRDPDCAIGLDHLRRVVKSGAIPTFNVGRRQVFDLDTLEQYLFRPDQPGKVHRVD